MKFERLSAVGASALSIWRLQASGSELAILISKQPPAIGSFVVVDIPGSEGEVLDQGLLWGLADKLFELHLHGGVGVAAGLRTLLGGRGWVEQDSGCARHPLLHAISGLQARCWSAIPFEQQLDRWSELDVATRKVEVGALLPWAEVLVETPKLVLVGPHNAGKSSLFNEWVQEERCTVSPHPGTTRDAVEATILLGSGFDAFAVKLIDTAGFGSAADLIDSAAQKITHDYLLDAWRVVWLFDQNLQPSPELLKRALVAENGLVFLTHADGERGCDAPDGWPRLSLLDNPAGAMRVVKEAIYGSLPALPRLGCSLPRDCTELLRMQELS